MKKKLIAPLEELREYSEIRAVMRKKRGVLALTGCVEAQKAHMIYGLSYDVPFRVIVSENDLTAKTLYENFRYYDPDVLLYPSKDLLFSQADVASNLLDQQRLKVMRAIIEKKSASIILPISAFMDQVTSRKLMETQKITFRWGEESDFDTVRKELVLLGYERCAETDLPGTFASRGDILDIWPLAEDNPVRIEFFGDEVDSMRVFDSETQRSIREIHEITVFPANDHTGMTDSFLKWFETAKTQFFLDEPNRMIESADACEKEFRESINRRIDLGTYDPSKTPEVTPSEKIIAMLNKMHCISLSMLEPKKDRWHIADTWGMTVQGVSAYNNSIEMLTSDLAKYQKKGYRVIVLSASHTKAKRLAAGLSEAGVRAFYTEDEEEQVPPGQIAILYGHASRGFEYPMIRFAVISESDIFGERQVRKRTKTRSSDHSKRVQSFSELNVGDYVVHENHGLGIYRGIEPVEVDGVQKDYIKLEYNGSNLFILATQLDLLQKYAGGQSEGHKPKLSKIGGQEWSRTRERVYKAVKDIAEDLVKLYAARQKEDGFICGPDTEWQHEFEEMFPYEETDDQLRAIEDTKRDMESPKIMDRLVCGDVGFGKTEIALRAAFKAVQEGLQVVYLVPTTVLAQQHFNTFTQRMKDYPVRVDLMCRLRTTAQQEKTIRDLKTGLVDIVIGTHRLLSKDVAFKKLGLLIIDEEQRFGVTHKEKIKTLKNNIDVLTLTATPIPRTLHMSLIGIRDMSILEEAPQDRVPIQTYVMEHDSEMIREAICRELSRGGQVYYVHNRVYDIGEAARRIQELVPEASVSFADGQMTANRLESIMVDFINGAIDVLVTTTIIETGLDIGNANTIIIDDADKLGLSQLYQLRGRVGRTNRTAYAFLMYRRDKMLREVAEKRLSAIREFTELGSGIKIAMRDLEIRGAGNLLGAEQSGQMEAVGYDLYCKMLSDAVREAKGLTVEKEFETVVDLNVDAYIPDSYIPNEFQKLDFYKRIAAISGEEDYEELSDELMDRYGELPEAVQNLMKVADLKAAAHKASVTEIKQFAGKVRLTILPDPTFDVTKVPQIVGRRLGQISIQTYETGTFFFYKGDMNETKMFRNLKSFVNELAETVPET